MTKIMAKLKAGDLRRYDLAVLHAHAAFIATLSVPLAHSAYSWRVCKGYCVQGGGQQQAAPRHSIDRPQPQQVQAPPHVQDPSQ